jgi:Protein of unknown function (DUF1501)
MHRRRFLRSGVMTGSGLALLNRGLLGTGFPGAGIGIQSSAQASAQMYGQDAPSGGSRHNFLYFQLSGAWDVCMAFDPKDRDSRTPDGQRQFDQPYAANEIVDAQGIRLAPAAKGFARFADRMAVVNGMDMLQDQGHSPSSVMTGVAVPSGSAPYLQAVLAANHPYLSKCYAPHLFLDSLPRDFQSGSFESVTTRTSLPLFVQANSPTGIGIPLSALADLTRDYGLNFSDSGEQGAFAEFVASLEAARAREVELGEIAKQLPPQLTDWRSRGATLGAYFNAGLVGSATFNFSPFQGDSIFFLDSHSNHYQQHQLPQALNAILEVIAGLESAVDATGRSALESTTVIITAEYCRTPLLNDDAGKDHNINTNTVVFLGKKVRSGMFGASGFRVQNGQSELHAGLPIDFASGTPLDTGKILATANVWRGAQRIFGVDLGSSFPAAEAVQFL